MPRDYWLSMGLEVADPDEDDDNAGYGSGSRISLEYSDEGIREILEMKVDFIMHEIKRLRELEAERDRKAAKPFWEKWLGA